MSVSPTLPKNERTTKKVRSRSRLYDPILVKKTPKQIVMAAVHKPYKPNIDVYLGSGEVSKHLKVKSLGSKASFAKLKTEGDQSEELTIDLMKRHYHDVNNNVNISKSPSLFLRRLEEAKNNVTCPDVSPFDPGHNEFTFLESLNKRAEHKNKNLKSPGGVATTGGLSAQRGAGVYLYSQSKNRKSRNTDVRISQTGLDQARYSSSFQVGGSTLMSSQTPVTPSRATRFSALSSLGAKEAQHQSA
jgi:hypothetical protein